jgi:hypothetical protein
VLVREKKSFLLISFARLSICLCHQILWQNADFLSTRTLFCLIYAKHQICGWVSCLRNVGFAELQILIEKRELFRVLALEA